MKIRSIRHKGLRRPLPTSMAVSSGRVETALRVRLPAKARPAKPRPIIAQVDSSGTAVSEKLVYSLP